MKEKKSGMYRIGEYARFMGVSADLLKHYEKQGLIQSQTAENGYRYYHFLQSTPLLACMSLRNYGFSLHEMQTLLNGASYGDVQAQLDRKIDQMQARLRFEERVVAEHRRISAWMEMMRNQTLHVTCEQEETVLFLPHSKGLDFIHDARIAELLESWIAAMPMVKSCRLFPDILAENPFMDSMWGLAVPQSEAEALRLPVNDVVMRIEGGLKRHVHVHHPLRIEDDMPTYFEPAARLLCSGDMPLRGPVLQYIMMMPNDGVQSEICCRLCAAIEAEQGILQAGKSIE